nr:shikimate kinase [uncultured Peptostreptococcus sp.]
MDLREIRTNIDRVDGELVSFLKKRLELVDRLGLYKYIEGIGIENTDREADIINKLYQDYDIDSDIEEIFRAIFTISKKRQARLFEEYRQVQDMCNTNDKNIILVGMPGSGKTSIGEKLSTFLNRKFIDTDELIYEKEASRPGEIIDRYGENYFREIEFNVLSELINKKGLIIATGGGIVMMEKNHPHIKNSNNEVFYIDRKIENLATDGRPLSNGGLETLKNLYDIRHCKYESVADYRVYNRDIYETVYKIASIYSDKDKNARL